MRSFNPWIAIFLASISLSTTARRADAYCLIRGGLGGPGNREDCCTQDISQWRPENLPVPMWINEDTDPDLWEGIRLSYEIWSEVPSSYFSAVDMGFTPINDVNPGDGVNLISFSNDPDQFPPGDNTIAFASGNWGTNVGSDETITGFDVIFNDVGFNFGYPAGPGEFSVVGISNHELGHGWGLAHTWEGGPPGCGPNCPTSTMYGFASSNAEKDETLELDDIGSLSLAYPNWLLRGTVREAGTGTPISDVLVTASVPVAKDTVIYGALPDPLPGDGATCGYVGGALTGESDGTFEFAALDSSFTVTFFRYGYYPDTITVSFSGIDTVAVDVELNPTPLGDIGGTLTDAGTQEGISGAIVLMQNGAPFDTAYTDGLTGEFSFIGVPYSLPPYLVYTGIEILADIPYPQFTAVDTLLEVGPGPVPSLDLTLLPADVFLVDDDEGEGYEAYFKDEIASTGRTYHHFDVEGEGESAALHLKQFPLATKVVWFTGDAATNTLTLAEQDSLAAFLDRGGRFLLTGQNIAEELDAAGSEFLENYLGVSHGGNVSYFMGRGVQGNPVTGYLGNFVTAGSGGANNQTSRDLLVGANGDTIPNPPAAEFIHYVASPADLTPRGTAAVYVEGAGSSKALLMGFGFEAISESGDTTRASREETMLAILNWFDGITGIGDDRPGERIQLPRAFALGQNYPNPFNPRTTIRFAIPEKPSRETRERVVLKVYNLRGQVVNILIDEDLSPGYYTANWDGRDQKGNIAPSGIYLYHLKWGGRSITRKMVVLK